MKQILTQLKTFEFYYKHVISFLSVSFIALMWIYMKGHGWVEYSVAQIVTYFLFIGTFYYLFVQNTAEKLSSLLYENNEGLWLLPGNLFYQFYKKSLLPKIYNVAPIFILLSILSFLTGVVSIVQLLEFFVLLVVTHVGYMFLSFNVIWITRQFNWESYGAFALRFIGMTWNGAYIPFVFMNASWFSIMMKTPYMVLGAPFQVLLKEEVFLTLFAYTVLHTVIQIVISAIPYKFYKITQRI